MSKTIRRKNEGWDNYLIYDFDYRSRVRVAYPKESKEYKEGMAKYHSDKLMTMAQVPKWYKVYYCRKPFRRKEKAALHLAAKYQDGETIFPKLVKDALYYW